ncbi:MAG: hypothetical protein ACE5EQ_12260, partial [Phycisphaerae bacterium]
SPTLRWAKEGAAADDGSQFSALSWQSLVVGASHLGWRARRITVTLLVYYGGVWLPERLHKEVAMQQVKITVEMDGEVVEQMIEEVDGTLERREEKIDALTRQLAAKTLQASVDRVAVPRPLFRRKAESSDTRDSKRER